MIRKNIKNIEKQADDPVCFFICKWGEVTGQTKHKKIIKKVRKNG